MTRRHSTRLLTAAGAALLIPGLAVIGPAGTAYAAAAPGGTISTVVGGPGGPGPATSAYIDPCGLDSVSGQLYFDNQPTVDRVSQGTGVLTPIAGNGVGLPGEAAPPDGTPALAATLPGGCGVTADGAGNELIAAGAQVLAVAAKAGTFYGKQMTAGRIYTVASGFAGGTGATSGGATDVQVDSAGNLVIAVAGTQASSPDPEGDSQVFVYAERAGTFYGVAMARGQLYHIGGSLDEYTLANAVPATQADLGISIGAVRLDSAGNVVVADQGGNGGGSATVPPQVRVIASWTGTFYGQQMKAGYIYTIAGSGTKTGNGVHATDVSLPNASGVAVDNADNVLVAASSVRVIAVKNGVFYGQKMTAGDIYTLPGIPSVTSVAVDTAGDVLFPAWPGVRILAAKTGSYYGKSVHAGVIYTIAGTGQLYYSGDGGPATSAKLLPAAVATLRSGLQTAVVAEWADYVAVVPGQTGTYFGRMMRAGYIYKVALAQEPASLAYDPNGNLLIADERLGGYGVVSVVASRTGSFYGQKMSAGRVYTAIGGGAGQLASGRPSRAVRFPFAAPPDGVATDQAGDVFILAGAQAWMMPARTGTHYGRTMTAGDIYLVAGSGNGAYGQTGDGGPATKAMIESQGLAVDGNGSLVLADVTRVRVVAAKTGTFYGQRMTVGDIYTVAGGGTQTGDGTPALSASFGLPIRVVAVDPAGNLLAGGYTSIFMVAERTGGFYGKAAHAGDVYTVAQDTNAEGIGDGGPAVCAEFNSDDIAVVPQTGSLLIADDFSGRLRSVSP
jgi:hypothetical protein